MAAVARNDSKDPGAFALACVAFFACGAVILVLSAVFLWFSILREEDLFWTSAGGFSVTFRQLVMFSHLPLFLVDSAGASGLFIFLLSGPGGSCRIYVLRLLLVLTCWICIISGFMISYADNLYNVFSGRPLHDGSPF